MNVDRQQSSGARRLFFALWPDDAVRTQVEQRILPIVSGRNARPIPSSNFHVTLVFLGSVSNEIVENVTQAANDVHSQAFELTFDHVETWTNAHIACLALAPTPSALQNLVDRLRMVLRARSIEPDQKDFRAHVTIARDWRDKSLDESIGPIRWPARDFVLVDSRAGITGSEYTVLNRWPLVAPASE